MSKTGGLGDGLLVDGIDVSGDISALSRIGGSVAALDFTGINKFAFERKGGIRDGSIEFTSFFNPATDETHDVLSELPTGDRIVTYLRGTAFGGWAANLVSKQVNYDPTRAADGGLTLGVQAQGQGYGLEWGRQLTAGLDTVTGAGSGTSLDLGAGTEHGGQLYLHVSEFTGTDVTFGVETSSDDFGADAPTGLGSLEQTVTAPGAWRTATTDALERYVRFYCYTTGGFTSATVALIFVPNRTAVTF